MSLLTAKRRYRRGNPSRIPKVIQDLQKAIAGGMALALCLATLAGASTSGEVCDAVAARAAQLKNVPVAVLQAITRTETGRSRRGTVEPWPWTVNMEGKGVWFDSEDEARAYVFRHFKKGARSFDVGCFQINYRWHGQEFDSIDQMFDPLENALYAAEFLKKLHSELGNWPDAAGAYHSRTPKYASRYKARFNSFHDRLAANPKTAETPILADRRDAAPDRQNSFPFLQRVTSVTQLGSLVPPDASNGSAFINMPNG